MPASVALDGLHCARCSYLLRGLDPMGCCPECGQSIAVTRVELALREQATRRAWRWRYSKLIGYYGDGPIEQESIVRRRAIAAGAAGLALAQGALVLGYPDARQLPPRGLPVQLSLSFMALGLIMGASMVLLAVSPSVPGKSRLRSFARWATRLAAAAVVAATAVAYAADHWVPWYSAWRVDDFSRAAVYVAHFGAVPLFHLLAAFSWQRRLRVLGIAFAFCTLLSVFAGAPILLLANGWDEPIAGTFRAALIVALAVFAVSMVSIDRTGIGSQRRRAD
jgi:hypothetical protein